jgi:hypothetical protein
MDNSYIEFLINDKHMGDKKMKIAFSKKYFVIGVVLLLLALAYAPTTQANIGNDSKNDEKQLFEVEIKEYKPDGSTIKNIVKLTQIEINSIKSELINANTNEDQISIFKKYNLISKDVKVDDLESGMYKKAESLGLDKNMLLNKLQIKLPILLQLFKKVNIVYFGGLSLRLGLTPIIRLINIILPVNLPDVDIIDLSGAIFGFIKTKGFLATNTLITFPSLSGMIGFVGFCIKIPLFMRVYTGYSVATFGFGLGLHIRNWNFNWNTGK